MDMLSPMPSPQKPEKSWPDAPAVRGKSYGVRDPMYGKEMLAVMTMETWLDFGTIHEAQRRKVEQQDATILQLKATNEVLTKALAELTLKHQNLRDSLKRQRKVAAGRGFM